jgi:hypothetical protein
MRLSIVMGNWWYNQQKDLREKWIIELGQIRIYDS